ncbi:hypothetical protein UVI_02039330 [Ustilaginoidea virens]|uniref:Uncharacterized protein n=1 Tax=Ustilaginoidea virens TaxID=1159556 RepID=A0A1B5KY38_USTVR|nr:hypothetical protein UVI_02039330 [Ustilaginoidea virens]
MRVAVAFVALAVASAQAQASYNYTSELDMTIDPNTVSQTQRGNQCIQKNAGDQRGQDTCTKNIQALCATYDPPKAPVQDSGSNSPSPTNGGSSTAAPTASSTGDSKVTSTSSHGLAGPTLAPVGNGALVAAVGLVAYLL